jgi:hypothetical protein
MEKLPKLSKGNLFFIEDPKIKEFIEYCKIYYSEKIEKINLYLNTEHNDWQMTVQEGEPGLVWVPWFIPTSAEPIIVGNIDALKKKLVKSRYSIVDTKKDEKKN